MLKSPPPAIVLLLLLVSTPPAATIVLADGLPAPGTTWEEARRCRDEVVERHLDVATDGWRWFAEASHGGEAGAPFVLLRLLPELAPDIWGPGDRFASFGFFDVPAEFYRAGETARRPLPLGLGWALSPVRGGDDAEAGGGELRGVRYASLTCAACHVGRVRGSDGEFSYLIGAPNGEIDVRKFRRAFELTVDRLLSSDAKLDQTVSAVQAKIAECVAGEGGAGRFFGGWYGIDAEAEAQELAIYRDAARCRQVLGDFARRVRVGRIAVEKQLATSYSHPNAPPLDGGTPGQSDGSGDLIPKLLLFREAAPEVFGREPAPPGSEPDPVRRFITSSYLEMPFQLATATDSPSVWRQADRSFGQWDGSVRSPFVRQIAAMTAVVGRPVGVNFANADFTTRFLHRLPPPPYPFPVDVVRAGRGEAIFKTNCASCHRPGNPTLYGLAEVGVDMNRARVVSNAEGRELLVRSFLAAIGPDYVATDPDGRTYRPRELAEADVVNDRTRPDRQGYAASPLDGLWARAPYLHNGSVPTLRHLLAPGNPDSRRPEVFVRGTPEYDTSAVGFAWDARDAGRLRAGSPTAVLFDTRWDGASNAGHDRPEVVVDGKPHRLDWSGPEHRGALEDLLEYLKTL